MESKENKYYTPTLEEFHVGFEFEYINSKNNSWIKSIFDMMEADFMEMIIDNETCRVKYLDKEDIESLGWKLKAEEVKGLPYKSHFCTFLKDKNELHIQLENVNGYYPNKVTIRGAYLNINPLIKNKSELKCLMKQLGIYE